MLYIITLLLPHKHQYIADFLFNLYIMFTLLFRWKFVTNGCIDGFSSKIVYLRCNGNNQANTILDLFLEVADVHGLPSRVRSDHGVENVNVAWYMLTHPMV